MNNYSRTFVALTEEQSGYSIAGKKAFGKAIIEARGTEGKLLISVQGLRPDAFYKIYLVAKNIGTPASRFSGVFMGNLPINNNGAAEVKMPFNAHSVADSGFMVGLFSTVAILVHNAPTLTAPLVGYVGEPSFWKNGFEIFKMKEDILEKEEVAEKSEVQGTRREVAEEPDVDEMVVEEPAVVAEKPVEEIDAKSVHTKFNDYIPACSQEDTLPTVETEAEMVAEPMPEPQAALEEPNWNIADAVNEIFRKNAKMAPFVRPDPNIEWRRIEPEHAAIIGFPEIATSEFAIQAFQRYKHLVLGRVPGSRYILGIPDMYTLETASTLESKGFVFKRCDGREVIENSYGYWIMVV